MHICGFIVYAFEMLYVEFARMFVRKLKSWIDMEKKFYKALNEF